jgi:hypothetical protein
VLDGDSVVDFVLERSFELVSVSEGDVVNEYDIVTDLTVTVLSLVTVDETVWV